MYIDLKINHNTRIVCIHRPPNCNSLYSDNKFELITYFESGSLLLHYPAGLVRSELARSVELQVVDNKISGVTASSDECTCRYHAGMHMPCRHMFAMCRVSGLHSFDKSLTDERWHVAHYHAVHCASKDCNPVYSAAEADVTISVVQAGPPRRPSTFAKFNAAKHVYYMISWTGF